MSLESAEEKINRIESRLLEIEKRNNRVERDKYWETSWQRRVLLALFTYLPIAIYLYYIQVHNPWLNAVVPTLGFLISTLTLPWFRRVIEDRSA